MFHSSMLHYVRTCVLLLVCFLRRPLLSFALRNTMIKYKKALTYRARLKINPGLLGFSLKSINGFRCFLQQETLPSLFSTGLFQEQV